MKALYVILLSTIIAFGNCQKAKDDNSTSKLLPFVFLGQKQNEINSIIVTYTLKNKEGEPLANVNVNSISTDSNQNLVRAAFKKPTKTDKDGICEVSYLYHQQTPTYKMEITDVFEKLIGGFNAITDPQKPLNVTIENVNGMQVTVQKVVATGNLGSNTTATVFNDTSAPIVNTIKPSDGSQNILTTEPISITFNEAIDPSTVNKDTFAVKQNDTQIEGTYTVNSNEVTFKPKSDFSFNTTYTVTLSSSILDRAGNAMSLINFQFTTGASNDRTPPSISSTFPISNAVGVVLYPILTVTFNEPIDPASVNNSTITVTNNGTSVNGTVAVNGSIVTFTPSTSLKGDPTTYTVTISAGIKDMVGNATTGSYSWNFTTELYTILPTVATPTLNVPTGIYSGAQNITISTTTGSAEIRYTTTGIDPTCSTGTVYSTAINIAVTKTLKAIACKAGMYNSNVITATYLIPTYSIGGTIAGLSTSGLVLQNNLGDDLVVNSSSTTFTFATKINSGTYSVTVKTQPATLNCIVNNGSGTANTDIISVSIACTKTLGTVTTIAGTAGTSGSNDGTGTGAKFNTPHGIASDGTNLYVTDLVNHTIRKVVISTGAVTTLAGTAGQTGTADGIGSIARFQNPIGIIVIGSDLYVVDSINRTIRKIVIATGSVSTFAGTAGQIGSANGIGAAARFQNPHYITSDGTNLYVTDTLNNTIRKIVISSAEVTTLAGTAGTTGSSDGTGPSARFNYPTGIVRVGSELYVADMNTHIIRKIIIYTGVVTTIAGTAGISGTIDGIGPSAKFLNPLGITSDGTNLYVTESSNCSVRKIVLSSGSVSIYAGLAGASGMNDGIGTNARFSGPMGIEYLNGILYTVEYGNHTIRKIE